MRCLWLGRERLELGICDWTKNAHEPTVKLRMGDRKWRPLTQFSASFPHPVQGVSPASLNALTAAPGRQVYANFPEILSMSS